MTTSAWARPEAPSPASNPAATNPAGNAAGGDAPGEGAASKKAPGEESAENLADSLTVTFADGKAPDAFRTIGEVAEALGLRAHVLRYWEEQFPMLRPVKRGGGRRYYRPEDIALLRRIDRLVHHQGYTLRGAHQVLEAEAAAHRAAAVAPTPPRASQPAASTHAAPSHQELPLPPAPVETLPAKPALNPPVLLARLRAIRAALARALDEA